MISLIDACDDAKLFNFPLYEGQRALLSAYEQGLAQGDRVAVWCIGRRSGKSTLAGLVALHSCLLREDLDDLSGIAQRSIAVVICPNEKQAHELLDAAEAIVVRSPLLAPLLAKATKSELEFVNGTRFAAFPASSRSVVGRAVRCFILDEAANFFDDESGASHGVEKIFKAMMPATAQFQGRAPVIVSSTPEGDANWFGQLVDRGLKGELSGTRVYRAASADMNPTLTPEFLAAEEADDPEHFRGQYLAELIGSGGAFIEPEMVDAVVAPYDELPPDACDSWIAGIDPAFTKDPFALVIVGRDRANPDRLVVGCVRTWMPPKQKPATTQERRALEDRVLGEVCDVLQRYRVAAVIHDQHQAAVVGEAIRRRGLWPEEFNLSASTKLDVFQNVKARIVSRTLQLPDHELLAAELKRLRARQTRTGRILETPTVRGTHCDTAIGLALAVAYIDRNGTPGTAFPFLVKDPNAPAPTRPVFSAPTQRPHSVADMRF